MVIVAIAARRTLRLGTSLWVTFFKIDDSHHDAAANPTNPLSARSQFRKESPWVTVHSQTARSGTSFSQNRTGSCSPIFAETRRWPFRAASSHDTPPRGQRALRALSAVTSLGPSFAAIVAACYLQKFQKRSDRNAELQLRLQLQEAGEIYELVGRILGKQHSGPPAQPQTEEQRGKRACAFTARGSISKAMKGLVGGGHHRAQQNAENNGPQP